MELQRKCAGQSGHALSSCCQSLLYLKASFAFGAIYRLEVDPTRIIVIPSQGGLVLLEDALPVVNLWVSKMT